MTTVNDVLSDTPTVDKERIDRVYAEIDNMEEILLDPDPLGSGPAKMNQTRSRVRNQMTRCTALELQILQDMGWYKHEITRLEAQMELKIADLLANNAKVKMGRSADDRRALAEVELKDEFHVLQTQKRRYDTLEVMVKVVRVKKSDLKNLQTQLRDQMKTCEHELGLGRNWGSRLPVSVTGELELEKQLTEVGAMTVGNLPLADSKPKMAPVQASKSVVAEGGAADLDDLLDSVSDPESDLDSILDAAAGKEPKAEEPKAEEPKAEEPKAEVVASTEPVVVDPVEGATDLDGILSAQDTSAVPAALQGYNRDSDIQKALENIGGDVPTTVVVSEATAPSNASLDDILDAL